MPAKDLKFNYPTQIGGMILAYSRQYMNQFIEKLNGFKDINATFYRTDTDSLIIHWEHAKLLLADLGSNLGDLDFDIKGKILKYYEIGPKCYACEYMPCDLAKVKDESIEEYIAKLESYEDSKVRKYHLRAKGMCEKIAQSLTPEHFKTVLTEGFGEKDLTMVVIKSYKADEVAKLIEYNDWLKAEAEGTVPEGIHKIGELKLSKKTIQVTQNHRITKDFLPRGNNLMGGLRSADFSRTINKTPFQKRAHIPANCNLASVPIGYQGPLLTVGAN